MATETWQPITPALLTATAATIYTAPSTANGRAVIVKLHVYNNDLIPRFLTVSQGVDAAGARVYDRYPIPARDFIDDLGPYVLNPSGIFQAFADVANTLIITGAVIEIAP